MSARARRWIRLLLRYHNVILEGVPGTGKTRAVEEIAAAWEAETGRELRGRGRGPFAATMHPALAYEDFVEGLRPGGRTEAGEGDVVWDADSGHEADAGFSVADGFIVRMCRIAAEHPDQDVLVLLDELNRCNVPKVLGDLLTTLEHSRRVAHAGGAWDYESATGVTLAYSGRVLYVPSNLYVLATRNTTDQSVAPLDAALRRRFAFARLEPLPGADVLASIRAARGGDVAEALTGSAEVWERLNHDVLRPCLGPDAQLGHSYLFGAAAELEPGVAMPGEVGAALGRLDAAGTPARRGFWIKTGAMTGGSRNQLDLSMAGKADRSRGSVDLFRPGTHTGSPRWSVDISRRGKTYRGSPISYPPDNGTWRILLNGAASDGETLTPPVNDRDQYRYRCLVFLETGPDAFEMVVLDAPREAELVAAGVSDETTGGRGYGTLALPTASAAPVVEFMWRYEILPQLADLLLAHSAIDLLAEDGRRAWLDARPELAAHGEATVAALAALDALLAGFGIVVSVAGTGLARAPVWAT